MASFSATLRRMRRDGRTLDHRTLEAIRRMAVERVREGQAPGAVIASYGFCRTTIYKWLRHASSRGRGISALAARKRDRASAQAHTQARAAGLSLDQRQEPDAIRV